MNIQDKQNLYKRLIICFYCTNVLVYFMLIQRSVFIHGVNNNNFVLEFLMMNTHVEDIMKKYKQNFDYINLHYPQLYNKDHCYYCFIENGIGIGMTFNSKIKIILLDVTHSDRDGLRSSEDGVFVYGSHCSIKLNEDNWNDDLGCFLIIFEEHLGKLKLSEELAEQNRILINKHQQYSISLVQFLESFTPGLQIPITREEFKNQQFLACSIRAKTKTSWIVSVWLLCAIIIIFVLNKNKSEKKTKY